MYIYSNFALREFCFGDTKKAIKYTYYVYDSEYNKCHLYQFVEKRSVQVDIASSQV